MNLKSPIFISGTGRAGTRLLRSIIGKIPSIYEVPRETYVFSPNQKNNLIVYRRIKSIKKESEKQKAIVLYLLLSIFYNKKVALKKFLILENNFSQISETWSKNKINSHQNKDSEIISYYQTLFPSIKTVNPYEIFDLILDHLCKENKCTRWVEKTPANIFNLKNICKTYPKAKNIAITRNPLAVYASRKNKDADKNIFHTIINWLESNKVIKNNKNQILVIRYEDLITAPEKTIKEVCDYINEPYSQELLEVEVLNNKKLKGKKGFNLDSLYRWEKELNIFEKLLIKLTTRNLAKAFGY